MVSELNLTIFCDEKCVSIIFQSIVGNIFAPTEKTGTRRETGVLPGHMSMQEVTSGYWSCSVAVGWGWGPDTKHCLLS